MGASRVHVGAVLAVTAGTIVAAGAPAQAGNGPGDVFDALHPEVFFPFDDLGANGLPVLGSLGPGGVVATVASADGGDVLAGPGRSGAGHSLRFEPFRPDQPATPAVVVVRPAAGAPDPTEPGTGPFAFGAEFVLDDLHGASATDNGDNLVQHGLFGAGSQYKIQLDGARPSCRVAGSEGAVQVHATEDVDPGRWYKVRCRRAGNEVTLRVVTLDGGRGREVAQYTVHGRTGAVTFGPADSPFSIGGKADADGHVLVRASDQFNGLVDDVFYRSAG